MTFLPRSLAVPAALATVCLSFFATPPSLAEEKLWDLANLKQAPEFHWIDKDSPIRSLLYAGDAYRDLESTEVFAYYATPATLDPAAHEGKSVRFPGVVLIHGGGGTAFAEWVQIWAGRGYAAVAMDLSGHRPPAPEYDQTGALKLPDRGHQREGRTRLEKGGPDQGHEEKFQSIGGELTDDWPRHAVANVVRAHSLIRSFPEVDPDRTAVTGISWGGYTTCLVASVDPRFRAAVPVYGCGFLFEGESVQKKSINALESGLRAEWIRRYDPSSHLARCRVPILFVNGTHDIHYPLDSYQRSHDLIPAEKEMRIEPRMGHSHPAGWAPVEIGLFIDSHCRDGVPLPKPTKPTIAEDGKVRVTIASEIPLKKASLHHTAGTGLRSERKWETIDAIIEGDTVIAPAPPAGANTWFITIIDERDALVSTTVQFGPNP